jgi:5-methylcytosine-specific restriction endonuclease McrA
MSGNPPDNLELVADTERFYPGSWRDAAIRATYIDRQGVFCSRCQRFFKGRRALSSMHADHIKPWKRGGLTTWENLQLLCPPCNIAKNDNILK